MNIGMKFREKALKTGVRAFPFMAAISPKLVQLSAKTVFTNSRIVHLMDRKRAVQRCGVSIITKRPLYAQIHITNYCNHACPMCNLWKKPMTMAYNDVIRTLNVSARMGVFIVNITGGEPLLHPHLIDIINYAAQLQFFIHLNTNGALPVRYFEPLVETPLDSIVISFHSLHQKKYEMMTGSKTSIEHVIRTIDYLKAHSDFHIALNYVITSYNSGETEEILAFAKSKGVSAEIHPVMVSSTNRESSTSNKTLLPAKKELLKAIEKVRQFKQQGGMLNESLHFYNFCTHAIERDSYKWNCRAGERFFAVFPDGQFGICQDFPMNKKITDDDFIQIWKSEAFRKKMDTIRKKCEGCLRNCYLNLEPLQNLFTSPPIADLPLLKTF
jgi:MoaA/NifB/PqqE/SkfB family radical SAM enzyme